MPKASLLNLLDLSKLPASLSAASSTQTHLSVTDTSTQPIPAGNPGAAFKRLVKLYLSVVLWAWQESTTGLYSSATHIRSCHYQLPPPPHSADRKQSATRWFTSISLQYNRETSNPSSALIGWLVNQWRWGTTITKKKEHFKISLVLEEF